MSPRRELRCSIEDARSSMDYWMRGKLRQVYRMQSPTHVIFCGTIEDYASLADVNLS